jgi:2-phospho-L-lactate guanylyltransferase
MVWRIRAGLNAAIGLPVATLHRSAHGISPASDLPMSRPATSRRSAALGKPLRLAPDEQEEGTNALALTPPEPDFFRFGPQSFQAHIEAAKTRGIPVRILRRPNLAHDLDTPDEYRRFAKDQLARSGALA